MAFAINHALVMTSPDDPAYENKPSDWNADLVVTGELPVANGGTGLSAGTSGGVLAYTATGTLASSALLAANAVVLGGGAGAAPATDANLTYTSPRLVSGAAATSGGFKAFAGNSVNSFLLLGGTTNQAIRSESNATGIHYILNGDSTGSGGPTEFRFGTAGALMWNSVANLGAGAIDTSLSRTAAGVLAVGTGATGSAAGTIRAAAYVVGATAGASFGPGAVASITVVNGIVTAIS